MEDETGQIETIPDESLVEQGFDEEQQDFMEHQQDIQEQQQFGSQEFGEYHDPVPKDTIYTFFKRILALRDSSKVANLDRRELGMLDLSVRNCEYLAKLGTLLHNRAYNDFFMSKAEITLATSMSKKGWLPELVVSQKKFTQRSVQPMSFQPAKKGFLGLGGLGRREAPQQMQ